jgi:hypothetical protein
MAEIPAPLMSRRTATAVIIVSILGAATAVATGLVPIVEESPLALVVARQGVLAAQALTLALAVFLVWRTLARRSRLVVLGALAGMAAFALLAVTHLAWLSLLAWPGARPAVEVAYVVVGAVLTLGLLVLGVAVVRRGHWRGTSRATLLIAGVLTAGLLVVAWVVPPWVPTLFAVWSLSFLGLAVGLRTRREVANAGVPQGAAPA